MFAAKQKRQGGTMTSLPGIILTVLPPFATIFLKPKTASKAMQHGGAGGDKPPTKLWQN
jgi:hypothetical protein